MAVSAGCPGLASGCGAASFLVSFGVSVVAGEGSAGFVVAAGEVGFGFSGSIGPALFRPSGTKEKSSASDDEIQGTCSPREARVTPTRVRFSVSSAVRSGTRISLSSSPTNRLRSAPVSLMTELSAAEYITSDPLGAITGARPAEKLRKRRSNGLRREASSSAILTPAPRLLTSPRMVSRLKPSRRTSASVQICASTGSR